MAENVPQSVEVPVGLSLFGSLDTELSPPDIPEGISPDNQDVVYLPGSVASRPCLNKIYSSLPSNVKIMYFKSFTRNDGTTFNLILDSNGTIWVENVSTAPGVLTSLDSVTPGSYASSVSAFNREWIVFHNGTNGTALPRQFDGTYLDPISQDGPSAPCSAADSINEVVILSLECGRIGGWQISSISQVGNVVTVVTTSPHNLTPSTNIIIAGATPTITTLTALAQVTSGSNTIFVSSITSVSGYGWQVGMVISGAGIPAGSTIVSITDSNSISATNTSSLTNLWTSSGGINTSVSIVVISQNATATSSSTTVSVMGTYNGIFNVQTIPTATSFTYLCNINGLGSGSSGTVFGLVASLTCASAHKAIVGDAITIIGASVSGTYPYDNNVNNNPLTWKVLNVTSTTQLVIDLTGISLSSINLTNFGQTASTTGNAIIGGMNSVGTYQVVQMFLTRQGYLTKPSAPFIWSSQGNVKVAVSSLAIGPPNVVARVIAFTGANGSNFFTITQGITITITANGTSTVVPALIVPDNTSTSAIFDFSDDAIFQGLGIDISGNDLFNQVVLGPATGLFFYGSRMAYWGQRNIVPNLLNMGLNGGYTTVNVPLGWTLTAPYGYYSLVPFAGAWAFQYTGYSGQSAILSQPCYQDSYGITILKPTVAYTFFLWAKGQAGDTGSITVSILSAPSGGTTYASTTILNSTLSTQGSFIPISLANLPASIASTAVLVVTLSPANGYSVTVASFQMVPTLNLLNNKMIISYVNNPEALDNETGILGSTDDPTIPQACFQYHDALYVLSSRSLHETASMGEQEPSSWDFRELSSRCGGASPRSVDQGENFAIWVSDPSINPPTGRGAYVFTGGQVYKVSQEVQNYFDSINPAAAQTLWVQNDPISRRVYFGLPTGTSTEPNLILVMDYRELDTASDMVSRPPVHISFTGKMVCSDLSRKWTRWNCYASSAGTIITSGGIRFCFGSGTDPNTGSGHGNIYWLNPSKYTDDDYGQVYPYYTTYFFINHEMEQALQVGLHRKLFKRYAAYITGIGSLSLTPYSDSLSNPYPTAPLWPLSTSQKYDIGDGLNVIGERCAFKVASLPLSGQTDNSFNLQKLIITLMQEPVAPIRFGAI